MASVNDDLLDLSIRHAVNIQRLSSGVVRRLIPILNQADADIVAQLLKRGATLEGSFTSQRLKYLLTAIREINHDAHVSLGKDLRKELRGLAKYEAGFQADMLRRTIPVAVDIVTPSAELLNAVVVSKPFEGRLLREWVSGLERGRMERLRDSIRLGMVQGETSDQIVRRIRGTRALNYRDGVMEIGRRGARAMVNTSVSHVSNAARDELYAANKDLIRAVRWTSTLDSRTTPVCQSRDGEEYPVGKGPRPPAHINCRSVVIPVTVSWESLNIDAPDIPPPVRANMNGEVPGGVTYNEWLRKQPASIQNDALGPTRGKLFRKGGLSVDKFVDVRGNHLTLEQLRQKESEAFASAGL